MREPARPRLHLHVFTTIFLLLSVALRGSCLECWSRLPRRRGCRCRFTLPVVDEDSSEATDCLSALAHDTDQTTTCVFGHVDVLLVEDNAINQKVGLRMLSTLGCNTTVANNGEECLELLTQNQNESPSDIVLMDCQMPGTSPNPT